MVAVNKSDSEKGRLAPPASNAGTEGPSKLASVVRTGSTIEEQLVQARASRSQAEIARQRIITEIMQSTKELYQKLVDEGEQILSKAKQLDADSELRHLESQRELEHSNSIRSEADAYREKVISQTQKQAQEMLQQAHSIKAEAVAFREKLLSQVREQAQQELDQAQSERIEADAYRENVIAQAQSQAQDIIDQTRSAAEQQGKEIVQTYSVEAEKILAQAELIKAAAQEELEAQKLYAEVANLETESKEVLERARAELSRQVSVVEFKPSDQSLDADSAPTSNSDGASQGYESYLKLDHSPEADQLPPAGPASEETSSGVKEEQPPQPESGETFAKGAGPGKSPGQLPDNELVLGVEVDGCSKAYPLQVVTEAQVINDSLNHQDLVVTFGPPSELGMVFNRTVDGLSLTFYPIPEASNGLMLMKDRETGTTWEALTGRAVEGSLVNSELEDLPSEYSFWFAWSDLHPETEIYSPDEGGSAAEIRD